MISPTISWVELVGTGLALVGVGSSLLLLIDAWSDWKAVETAGLDGADRIGAVMSLRNEAVRVAALILVVIIGIALMLLPNTPGPFTPARITLFTATTLVVILVVYGSFADRRDRQRIMAANASRRSSDKMGSDGG